ncbi:MAG: hypothetical protein AAGB15_03945 [Pseudomonadota bacterium]
MLDLRETLTAHLRDPASGWNIGSFGAIAEFHQDPGETIVVEDALERATDRGAIRIDRIDGVTPIAWEALSKNPERWQQGIALCLPVAEATRSARTVLTELGADDDAIRARDRDGILFDMGLGQRNLDFCIRTSDPDLLATLRANTGRALAEPDNRTMGAILSAHPHRVALSALGRCEVFQMIGGPATGGVSPAGPHTHVLPGLMKAGRTHSANTPIPDDLMPAMSLHPGSPVMGPLGEDRDFDAVLFDAFQSLLVAWGPEIYVTTKQRIWDALDSDAKPEPEDYAVSRLARTARRNALRQRARMRERSDLLLEWFKAHDRGAFDADSDMPGH